MTAIISIDPGTTATAWLILSNGLPIRHAKESNESVLQRVRSEWRPDHGPLSIEAIASFGMPVGKEVFQTCYFIGRIIEAWEARGGKVELIYRRDVKLFHCFSARANDANIRAAIIDRFGGKERAIGLKKSPGPLFGIKADVWSALALALTVEGQKNDLLAPAKVEESELVL